MLTVPVRTNGGIEQPAAPRTAPPAGNGANGAGTILGGSAAPTPAPRVATPAPPAVPAAPARPAVATRQDFAVNGAVGRMGLAAGENVPIYRDRKKGGARYYTAKRGTRLLVVSRYDSWYGVRMIDGSIGWADAGLVTLTDTELVGSSSAPSAANPSAGGGVGWSVVQAASRFLGVPYRWGGTSNRGVDCSGLVLRAFGAHGIRLPRVARDQFLVGQPVAPERLQAGDRIYFASGGGRIDHTGIYIGNGQFIHASGRRQMVCIDNLFQSRYWSIYVGAKR
jgi:cell wall-associated NlpC family hydrolase